MKKLLLFTLLSNFTVYLFAQDTVKDSIVKQPATIFRISIIIPGIEVEQTIGRNKTIVFDLYTGLTYQRNRTTFALEKALYVNPIISVQPRFYTNLEERRSFNLSTDSYSGTYIGFPVAIILKDFGIAGGFVGGFQKSLGKILYWNLALGAGVQYWKKQTNFTPVMDMGFGFFINR